VRGVTRCALIRSSTQYVFATLLTSHLRSSFAVQILLISYFPAPCQRGKGEGYASGACHPYPEQIVWTQKLRGCLIGFCGLGHNIVDTECLATPTKCTSRLVNLLPLNNLAAISADCSIGA
jgi:hypothetical protein